jgi:hypothetical protein
MLAKMANICPSGDSAMASTVFRSLPFTTTPPESSGHSSGTVIFNNNLIPHSVAGSDLVQHGAPPLTPVSSALPTPPACATFSVIDTPEILVIVSGILVRRFMHNIESCITVLGVKQEILEVSLLSYRLEDCQLVFGGVIAEDHWWIPLTYSRFVLVVKAVEPMDSCSSSALCIEPPESTPSPPVLSSGLGPELQIPTSSPLRSPDLCLQSRPTGSPSASTLTCWGNSPDEFEESTQL